MNRNRFRRIMCPPGPWLTGLAFWVATLAPATAAWAGAADPGPAPGPTPFTPGKVFTFLFLTLGPFKLIGPFYRMTQGRDGGFRTRLALGGSLYSLLALIAAATLGQTMLGKWGISGRVLQLTVGIILFLVALRPVLGQYGSSDPAEAPAAPASSASALMFSPLAFPSIVTPHGIALLMLLFAARPDHVPELLGVAGLVLVINLVAMLSAHRLMRTPLVAPALGVVSVVLSVLLVALGVQTIVYALRALLGGAAVNLH